MPKVFQLFFVVLLIHACSINRAPLIEDSTKKFIALQLENTLDEADNPQKIPRTINPDGSLKTVNIYNWASGFFAGNLWYMYALTGDEKWRKEANQFTVTLDTIQYWSGHHDVGFMINCSYGNGLKFGGIQAYKPVIIQAAESLSKRYNEKVKAIKSWDYQKSWDGDTEWF